MSSKRGSCGNGKCECRYPKDNCGTDQYLYYKEGKITLKEKVLPCEYDYISCCTTRKPNCGALIPGSQRCNDIMYNYCSNNFDDICKTVCSNPVNYPSWCDTIGEKECDADPDGEICTYFCSDSRKHLYCPIKVIPYIPKEYSVLFYVACVICVLVLFLLLLL
jgi:hypothetical protein